MLPIGATNSKLSKQAVDFAAFPLFLSRPFHQTEASRLHILGVAVALLPNSRRKPPASLASPKQIGTGA
jgi:hypothetical protein